jgi:hypothetical protein
MSDDALRRSQLGGTSFSTHPHFAWRCSSRPLIDADGLVGAPSGCPSAFPCPSIIPAHCNTTTSRQITQLGGRGDPLGTRKISASPIKSLPGISPSQILCVGTTGQQAGHGDNYAANLQTTVHCRASYRQRSAAKPNPGA